MRGSSTDSFLSTSNVRIALCQLNPPVIKVHIKSVRGGRHHTRALQNRTHFRCKKRIELNLHVCVWWLTLYSNPCHVQATVWNLPTYSKPTVFCALCHLCTLGAASYKWDELATGVMRNSINWIHLEARVLMYNTFSECSR